MHYGSGSGTGHDSRYIKSQKIKKLEANFIGKIAASDIEKERFCFLLLENCAKYCLDPEPEPKLFQSRNRNRNKSQHWPKGLKKIWRSVNILNTEVYIPRSIYHMIFVKSLSGKMDSWL